MKARTIDAKEFMRAVAATKATSHPERDRVLLLLSGKAGMRIDEIRNLEVEDVMDRRTGEVRERIHLPASRTKTRTARDVHINAEVRGAIRAWLAVRRGEPTGPLFVTQYGSGYQRTALVHHFKNLYRNAGIDTSSHAGRRLFIHTMDDNRAPLRVIQAAVGHKSLSATQAYLEARPSEIASAVEKLS